MVDSSVAPSLDGRAMFYMFLLALQFGIQPSLTRHFTPKGINLSTVILVQEILKFCLAAFMLRISSTTDQIREIYAKWSLRQWANVAAIPAGLYAVQNVAALTAYQHLDALTFNVLNQTKTLSAALCCYVVMGRGQSSMQVVSLLLLLVSTLVMERILPLPFGGGGSEENTAAADAGAWEWGTKHVTHGVIPILVASFLSGLTGALSQRTLQGAGGGSNPYWFSMELCAASAIVLAVKLGHNWATGDFSTNTVAMWDGWTPGTFIPIAVNAGGGVVVGLVTKYAGSVQKGFALIFGMLLSGLVQEFVTDRDGRAGVRLEQMVGGVMAAVSLYLHATNPPREAPKKVDEDKKKKN